MDLVLDKLSREIRKINLMLYNDEFSTTLNHIIPSIEKLSSISELNEFYTFLSSSTALNIFSSKDNLHLLKIYTEKIQTLLDEYDGDIDEIVDSPFLKLSSLMNQTNSSLIIDGHNILHQLDYIFEDYFEDGIPGREAREYLERLIANLAKIYPLSMFRLYFDSPEPSEYNIADNIKVIFSGGGYEEHRADNVMISYLELLRENDENAIFATSVVTDDRDIQQETENIGASIIDVNSFGLVLRAILEY